MTEPVPPSPAYLSVETPRVHDDERALASASYPLRVDPTQFDRAIEIRPLSLQRPHMRAFHVSWISAAPGFLGWYAIPPLMPVIKQQLGLTTGEILNSDIASTASTIASRIVVGPLLELYGPQRVHSLTLWLGAIPIAAAAFVTNATGLLIVRFFIGLVGCIFVSSQFWTTITFAKNIVGTSNAITGGLGLAGIGYAFLILPYINAWLASSPSISVDLAWRLTIALPAVVMVIMGSLAWHRADSCPMGEFHHLRRAQHAAKTLAHNEEGHDTPPSPEPSTALRDVLANLRTAFRVVLHDRNTYLLVLHYGVCFGAELQLNNMGALYFYEEFSKPDCNAATEDCHLVSKATAATLAATFGLMNMFARALGGLASDDANRKRGLAGRKQVQFTLLCLEGAMVIVLSRMTHLGASLAVYILVAIAAQAAGGSTFGLVPYVNDAYTGTVTGLVGAGGNLGGVVFGVIFRCSSSRAEGLLIMGCLILASSVTAFLISLKHVAKRTASSSHLQALT